MGHETVVIDKQCPRCGQENRERESECMGCGLELTRWVDNGRFMSRDPAATHRTVPIPAPKPLVDAGVRGEVWVEVIPAKQGDQTYYRAEIKATGFADGVDAGRIMPVPTHPHPGYTDFAQAIGVADGWLDAMREGFVP